MLRGFEREGRDSWLRGRDDLDAETDAIVRDLRVRLIYRLTEAAPGSVIVGSASAGGATSPELLVGVAEDHANRCDNIAKLGASTHATERHLLVWIHADFHQLTAAMSFDIIPAGQPDLPPEVDAVWLASAFERPTVWRVEFLSLVLRLRPYACVGSRRRDNTVTRTRRLRGTPSVARSGWR